MPNFNTYLVKTVFHGLSVVRISFLMETDFLHRGRNFIIINKINKVSYLVQCNTNN